VTKPGETGRSPATNRPVGGNYDANGNAPIGVWDVENHLVSQTLDGQALTWTYDAAGKRIRRYRVVNGQPLPGPDRTMSLAGTYETA
jgi:YD repeat-containing protein